MNKIMRKSLSKYIAFAVAAATALSCALHEDELSPSKSLSLEFNCSELLTRADGDPETAIESIDYFLYTSPTGAAVYHNRITTTSTTVVLDDVAVLAEDGKTCYVYAVANLPSSVSLTGTETIAALKNISVTTDFTAAQTSFVMDSKEYVTTAVGSNATVPLHRLAAKLTMAVNIPASITNESTTYEPDYGNLRIYYVNATSKGSFDGSYMTYGTSTDEEANKDYYFNYPTSWPVSISGDGPYVGETVTPFYTYPQEWATEEVHEPYFKVILPWAVVGETGSTKPYYYKVVIPNGFDGKIDRNTFYKFVMDIGVLGSEVDDGTVVVSGDYYVVDWNEAFKIAGDNALTKGKYLYVAQTEYSIYAENSIEIPVTSSHNLSISARTGTYTNFNSDNPSSVTLSTNNYTVSASGRNSITLTHNLVSDINSTSLDCSIYTFTITIGNAANCDPVTVTVTQYPSLYIKNEKSNQFVFVNGSLRAEGPSSIWELLNQGSQVQDDGDARGQNKQTLGGLRYLSTELQNNNNFNIYTVNVSNLSGTEWYIADPRSSETIDIDRLRGGQTNGQPLNNYREVDFGASNAIAPSFKIASSAGASIYGINSGYTLTYEQAMRRCASYQENGYPAGRWRIPTTAEVQFVIKLSRSAGKIPALFSTNYWSSGGTIVNQTGNVVTNVSTASVRCVYDSWYWGDQPIEQYKTRWSGWQTETN